MIIPQTSTDWKFDKNWSDRFLPNIKRILGEYLISTAPIEEDAQRNTDLIVLTMAAVRIGCRIRRHNYLARYADEFTIRSDRPSGTKTELAKIIEGWGDYFFYGFSNEDETDLVAWFIGDLKAFRIYWSTQLVNNQGRMPGIEQPNGDGSSHFRAFKIGDLPNSFIIARKSTNG